MKTKVLNILILLSLISLPNCKKDADKNSVNFLYLSAYNGSWTGTVKMVKKGSCDVEEPSEYATTQNWKVDRNGNITILDTLSNSLITSTLIWTGTIDIDGQINIISTQHVSCSSGSGDVTLRLNGTIISNPDSTYLNTTVEYALCPPNCLFDLIYSIKQQ